MFQFIFAQCEYLFLIINISLIFCLLLSLMSYIYQNKQSLWVTNFSTDTHGHYLHTCKPLSTMLGPTNNLIPLIYKTWIFL